LDKLIDAQASLAQNRAENSTPQAPMVGHDSLCKRLIAAHDDVAPDLSASREACALKSGDTSST